MAKSRKQDDAGAAEVQQTVDEVNERGLFGEEVDPTPNENYTLEGVVAEKPTPETDDKARAEAQAAAFRERR